MGTSNYQIVDISSFRPTEALNIGQISGLTSYFIVDHPQAFILEASGKFYTVEYNSASCLDASVPHDELGRFVDAIIPFLIWDLIVL